MRSCRLIPIIAVALMPASPAFALSSIAAREPAGGALWLAVIAVTGLSWVMACRRWWLPLVIWPPVALLVSALIAELIDPVIAPMIREELGAAYIAQADLCSALVIVVPLMFASIRMGRLHPDTADRRRFHGR